MAQCIDQERQQHFALERADGQAQADLARALLRRSRSNWRRLAFRRVLSLPSSIDTDRVPTRWLAAALTPVGEPVDSRRDAPWTPWLLRRNEIGFKLP